MFLYYFRVYNVILFILTELVPTILRWIKKCTCYVKNGTWAIKGKWRCSMRAREWELFGDKQNPRYSDWCLTCAQLVFDEEMNVKFPAVGSALCHPALSQVIPSLPGQSGAP